MEEVNKRMKDLHCRMVDSAVVRHGDTTPNALAEFTELVRQAAPTSPFETTAAETLRLIHDGNPTYFYKCMHGCGAAPLILLLEGEAIVNLLRLRGKINITWNDPRSEYDVRVVGRRPPRTSVGPPRGDAGRGRSPRRNRTNSARTHVPPKPRQVHILPRPIPHSDQNEEVLETQQMMPPPIPVATLQKIIDGPVGSWGDDEAI